MNIFDECARLSVDDRLRLAAWLVRTTQIRTAKPLPKTVASIKQALRRAKKKSSLDLFK